MLMQSGLPAWEMDDLINPTRSGGATGWRRCQAPTGRQTAHLATVPTVTKWERDWERACSAQLVRARLCSLLLSSDLRWVLAPLPILATFSVTDCGPCPARGLCTTSKKKRRQLTDLPRGLAEAQAAARTAETTAGFQAYARRAGVEGTMHQATSHGARRARYRGLPKTRLDHVYMACALNLIRLEAFRNGTPLDRRRTSHLARLELGLAAGKVAEAAGALASGLLR